MRKAVLAVLLIGFIYLVNGNQHQVIQQTLYHPVRNDDYDPLLVIFALPLLAPWLLLFFNAVSKTFVAMAGTMGGNGDGNGNGNGYNFTMKVVIFAAIAVLALIGMTTAQFGYQGYGYGTTQTDDSTMNFGLLAFLFVFLILFTYRKSVPLYFQNQSLGVNVQTGLLG